MIDLLGQRFGRLLIIAEEPGLHRSKQLLWRARCDCGTEIVRPSHSIRSGNVKSCGCLRKEMGVIRGTASKRHGEAANGGSNTVEYRAWAAMKSRCQNPNHKQFPDYGGRGITVCARWQTFENFLADIGRRPSKFYSLDRIDNGGPYAPENCRWATYFEQNNNRRRRGEGSKAMKRKRAHPVL